jgi:hypothetical protein
MLHQLQFIKLNYKKGGFGIVSRMIRYWDYAYCTLAFINASILSKVWVIVEGGQTS